MAILLIELVRKNHSPHPPYPCYSPRPSTRPRSPNSRKTAVHGDCWGNCQEGSVGETAAEIALACLAWPLCRIVLGILLYKFLADLVRRIFLSPFLTTMRRNNPATKSTEKSGCPKNNSRKSVLPKWILSLEEWRSGSLRSFPSNLYSKFREFGLWGPVDGRGNGFPLSDHLRM